MSNLVLTGFMATGKTAVGREVARRLGRPFVDMDEEIEARAGKPISRLFAEEGEATFRQAEAVLCRELSGQQGLVIATGGGALIDPANRARMARSGTVVCLSCSVDEIVRRVGRKRGRPLLDLPDPRAETERLLEARRPAYRAIPWQVDTTGLSVAEAAARVIELAGLVTLPVRCPGGHYNVHIGRGLLRYLGGALAAAGACEGGRVAVVSNPLVAPLYGDRVEGSLRAAGFQPFSCSMPDGEPHKTLATVAGLYEQFLAGRLDRSDTVLALGGGVIGDVAGFAAATFLRGVRLAQVPTTLLAMVDSSVGGKTGVDLPQGKNLVGAFKQPALVVIDPNVLATLPAEQMRSGLAEAIKHAIVGDPALWAELERGDGSLSSWWGEEGAARIAGSLAVKVALVEEDPFERGRRALLNLGHTVGHALEKLAGFTIRHGEAVSVGLVAAARIAAELGRAERALAGRIEAVLSAWGLPLRCPSFDAGAIWNAMAHDKKRGGRGLRWVLPCAIGRAEVAADVPPEVVRSVLRSIGAR